MDYSNWTQSNSVTPSAGGSNPFPAPATLTATAGDNSVTLEWTAAPGAVEYTLERKSNESNDWVAIGAASGAATTMVDGASSPAGAPQNGTTYTYRIKAGYGGA